MRYRSLKTRSSHQVANGFSTNIQSVTSSLRPETTADGNMDQVSISFDDRTGKFIWRIINVESKTRECYQF